MTPQPTRGDETAEPGPDQPDAELERAAVQTLHEIAEAVRNPEVMAHINWGYSHSRMEGYNEGFDEGWQQGIAGKVPPTHRIVSVDELAAIGRVRAFSDHAATVAVMVGLKSIQREALDVALLGLNLFYTDKAVEHDLGLLAALVERTAVPS